MKLPSLELSNDSYWLPINAVFQKRHTLPAELFHSYDLDIASFNKGSQVELPSLEKKNGYTGGRRATSTQTVSLPDPSAQASAYSTREIETPENPPNSLTELGMNSSHAIDMKTLNRHQSGSGRLLSGKLRGSSSCTRPVHYEEIQSLAIGVQRSPYDKLVANLAAMAHAKKSMQELYNGRTEYSRRVSAQESKKSSIPGNSDVIYSDNIEAEGYDPSQFKLTLNKIDIMQERPEHEELLAESAIFCEPPVELKTENSDMPKPSLQDSLLTPSNMAMTFAKPRKLFSMMAVQNKMQQHTYSDSKNTRCRTGTVAKRARDSQSLCSSKHRLALNKENRGREEGVFGTQAHPAKKSGGGTMFETQTHTMRSGRADGSYRSHQPPHQARCAIRSQERMKLRLKTATNRHREYKSSCNSAASTKKVQVYLIKTTRPLEDILPQLKSTEVYCQEHETVDNSFGE
jgi:hypothetical protein